MLAFAFLLVIASSAFALPSVSIHQVPINSIAPLPDKGGLINRGVTDRSFELVDGGDTNIYILTIQQIINDFAAKTDSHSQAVACAQTLAVLGEMATGIPGDACDAAAVVDAYASGREGGAPVRNYLNRLAYNIDMITQLAINPSKLRYTTGARGNCVGGGRTYQFEASWKLVLERVARSFPYNLDLLNEEYCAANRLYSAFNSRSNNVGAAVSASVIPDVVEAVKKAIGPITDFLRIAASGNNPSYAAAVAKTALLRTTS